MNIRLDGVGHLVVDNQRNVLHIDTTTSEIRSHENIRVSSP